MKLTKENVCVFIEDEAQLEQARSVLECNGEGDNIDTKTFKITNSFKHLNYLYYSNFFNDWGLGFNCLNHIISLTELEITLKND